MSEAATSGQGRDPKDRRQKGSKGRGRGQGGVLGDGQPAPSSPTRGSGGALSAPSTEPGAESRLLKGFLAFYRRRTAFPGTCRAPNLAAMPPAPINPSVERDRTHSLVPRGDPCAGEVERLLNVDAVSPHAVRQPRTRELRHDAVATVLHPARHSAASRHLCRRQHTGTTHANRRYHTPPPVRCCPRVGQFEPASIRKESKYSALIIVIQPFAIETLAPSTHLLETS